MPPNTPAERGRRLEQHVAGYFAAFGYAVQTNQVLVGRSGGRHEIDVLAVKSDPLTTVRVAVECKAWSSPIEKDVVSKLHYVMTDLGIHKGIVVSLAGMRAGAHTAAAELGIDVWGPDELRHHLGDSVFADVTMASLPAQGFGRLAYAWPFRLDSGHAESLIRNHGKGRFGLRTLEAMGWFAPLWIPAYLLQLTVAQRQTGRLRQHLASSGITNIYDALGGEFITAATTPPVELALGQPAALTPLRPGTQIQTALRKAVDARQRVTSGAAIQRHDATLQRLGLPVPCESLSIDRTIVVYLPAYAGLLRANGQDRLAVVNAFTATLDQALSQILTAHLAHVRMTFLAARPG